MDREPKRVINKQDDGSFHASEAGKGYVITGVGETFERAKEELEISREELDNMPLDTSSGTTSE